MKKLNKKGVTLVELIVSFAIVGVAIIYFFQTLYTVKTIYTTSEEETKEYVVKNYGLRLVDAYIEKELNDNFVNPDDDEVKEEVTQFLQDMSKSPLYVSYNGGVSRSEPSVCNSKLETSLYKFNSKVTNYSIDEYKVIICY